MVSNGPPTRPRECNGARVTKPIKNKPDKYPYWDNLGADWLYGGIYVYGEYPDDDDLESANVYVEHEPYD